jgi:voltage-gated potassium channel
MFEVIFGHDTRAGKAFDVALLATILGSVAAVMAESVPRIQATWGRELYLLEWGFTLLFLGEYVLRLLCVREPARYAMSFFGIVDLMAIVPTFLSFLVPGSQELIVVRAVRLLRIFRVLKLSEYNREARRLVGALRASLPKIAVFVLAVVTIVVIVGALMYLVEGPENGFTSIPTSVYWAIVTLTTVGYGDVAPQTPLGRAIASALMIAGYGIIAVPTGIATAEAIGSGARMRAAGPPCSACDHAPVEPAARFCSRCGSPLRAPDAPAGD